MLCKESIKYFLYFVIHYCKPHSHGTAMCTQTDFPPTTQ